jgi:hypothetical protein
MLKSTIIMTIMPICLMGCGVPTWFENTSEPIRSSYNSVDAEKAVVDCFYSNSIKLDDGISDPVSVAYGLEPPCSSQWDVATSMEADERNLNLAAKIRFIEKMKSDELKIATSVVLTERKNRALMSR